jgi:hypothetical protein
MNSRQWALLCSAIHFGLSNLNSKGTPASTETVIAAAQKFEVYLDTQEAVEEPVRGSQSL